MTVAVGSFSYTAGDDESRPEAIAGFGERWRELLPDTDFAAMGTGTFARMTGPVLDYVVDCVAKVVASSGVLTSEVDRLVLATSDGVLARLPADFAVSVLRAAGLTSCVPSIVSYQQCCSSLEGLRYASSLLDGEVRQVVLVALDFTPEDLDRVRTFAVFGDAVGGCLVSRAPSPGSLELMGSALTVDWAGLMGEDSFRSRQAVARNCLEQVLAPADVSSGDLVSVLGSNLFAPVATFNAMAAGISRAQLHFPETMRRYGHCGNADWIINLVDHIEQNGTTPGSLYLAQASAPGFFACALLKG